MAAPEIHLKLIEPPHPNDYKSDKSFRFSHDMWMRSGGLTAWTPNLKGLNSSVAELNTLVGIDTADTVQFQLNGKVNTTDIGTMAVQNKDSVDITGGTIVGVGISGSTIALEAGGSGITLGLGGRLAVSTTSLGNSAGVETTLQSFSVPANTLSSSGEFLEVMCWGTIAANANNKQIKVILGTTTLYDTTLLAANAGSWSIRAQIMRVSLNLERSVVEFNTSNGTFGNSANVLNITEDLSTPLDLKITGNGIALDDIVSTGLIVKWF